MVMLSHVQKCKLIISCFETIWTIKLEKKNIAVEFLHPQLQKFLNILTWMEWFWGYQPVEEKMIGKN